MTSAAAVAAPGPSTLPPRVVSDPCPAEALQALCGHVDVPLDRASPQTGALPIAFELYSHTGPGPAKSTIFADAGFGGPGSTLASRDHLLRVFASLRERHDLLLVDDRGRGQSAAIDCPALQHGTAPFREAAASCAEQLGSATQRYGVGDIAKDFEAVRVALGIDAVDFYGVSYGAADIAAYATRFGEHLRSIVIEAPYGPPHHARKLFTRDAVRLRAAVDRVPTLCERSPACSELQPHARGRIEDLVRRLRRRPLRGSAQDANGTSHTMTIDPAFFLVHMLESDESPFFTTGELPAAAEALRQGDSAPFLRLAAESDTPIPADIGDPTGFSVGAFAATLCLEHPYPWSADAPPNVRLAQWEAAVRDASDRPFSPFRAEDVLRSPFDEHDFCLGWPAPTTASPTLEPGAQFPHVPTLVLAGDLDTVSTPALAREMADLFPGSRFVSVTGAGHDIALDSPCAVSLITGFIAKPATVDSSCADRPGTAYPGVGRFPRIATESPPATAKPGGRATEADLRIARTAADTALDALKRSDLGDGAGPGLRGGTFHTDHAKEQLTITLRAARFAGDVAVSGRLQLAGGGALQGDLTVEGPSQQEGKLHVSGKWLAAGDAVPLTVKGTLGGRKVVATTPSA